MGYIITQAWRTLDTVDTSSGIFNIFTYSAGLVSIFIPLTLFAFFIISCIGSYYASIRTSGRGDFPASFAAAGFITTILAVSMTLVPGLINLPTLVITSGISIIGILWLFFSRDR